MQARIYVLTPLLSLVLGTFTANAANADSKPTLKTVLDKDLRRRLRGRQQPANSKKLLYGTAKPYAKAQALLSQGDPTGALRALKGGQSALLADREALLRAAALAARGDQAEALSAYVTALELAETLDVGLDAARGLRRTLHALDKSAEELVVLDALLDVRNIDNRSELLLARAHAYRALKRKKDAAEQAWRLARAYPTSPTAKRAETLLASLSKAGVKAPVPSEWDDRKLVRNLIRARAFDTAETALAAYEKQYPKRKDTALMLKLDLLKRRRDRDQEQAILTELYNNGLKRGNGPETLYRLARLAMGEDNDDLAIKYFDELTKRFERSRWAHDGEFLAAWLPYNNGDNLETHKRMLAFAERRPRSEKRTEALWFAGWAAYVADKHELAEAPWRTMLTEHADSTLVPHVWYWMGRIAHARNHAEEARNRYRNVLGLSPLSYYGFWATARLAELGEVTVLKPPPPEPKPASLSTVIERLGPDRPRLIDRAVALHAAGLEAEAATELRAASSALRKIRDAEGRTLVADMLHQLGAHHLAFRLASSLTEDGGELASGEPWLWRAWRHAYPDAFEDEVRAAHDAHEVETNLVWAVMRTESAFRPWVQSRVGAKGLMQLMPRTARAIGQRAKDGRAHAARYRDPDSNVWLGAWYLKKLGERYDGQLAATIAAYNAGPRATDRWVLAHGGVPLDEFIERIPYKETRRYTRRVIESYFVYRQMKGLPLPELPRVIAKTPPSGGVGF